MTEASKWRFSRECKLAAQARIVELERKIARQELELEVFQQALRHVGEAHPSGGAMAGGWSPTSPGA